MQYLIIVAIIGFILLEKDRSILNPAILFSYLWLGIIVLSTSGFMGLITPDQSTYIIVFIGILAFYLGVKGRIKGQRRIYSLQQCSDVYEINYFILYIFAIMTIIVILPDTIISYGFLRSGYKLGDIHHLFTADYSGSYSGISTWKYYVFLYPTLISINILAAYDLWFGKHKGLLQMFSLILVGMRTIQYGGRGPIFYLFFYYVFCGLLYFKLNRNKIQVAFKRMSKRKERLIILLIIIVGMIAFLANISRLIDGMAGLSKMIVEYFGSCIEIMDLKLKNINGGLTFGGLSFAGFEKYIDFFVVSILRIFGLDSVSTIFPTIQNELLYLEEGVFTGLNISNAFVTPFYYFYRDGWIFGVIIMSLCWGIIVKSAYKSVKYHLNIKTVYFWLLTLHTVFFSMVRCWFASPEFAIAFLSFYLFIRRKKNV